MTNFQGISIENWIGIYGAVLSTAIASFGIVRFFVQKAHVRRQQSKFQTDLYFLRKINQKTKEVHPIVVLLLANLGTARLSFKSLEYDGFAENGGKTNGCMGWYEQPEELYGIRKRLLPIVLESGQTADLPMIEIGYVTRIRNLRIWLTDFDDRRFYIDQKDIAKVKRDVEKFLSEKSAAKT